MNMFQRAEKSQIKLKIAITGVSGSGKTFSSLRLASGIGKKIALVDTEKNSASFYADKFQFDVLNLAPPFTTDKYEAAISAAVSGKYDVIILDSISHAWSGPGGLLEQKEQIDAQNKGNSYTNWATITKKHEKFISAMLHSDVHLIATMRSKQDYVLQDRNGKQVPTKVGMAPIQRDGLEYEYSLVLDIAMNHEASASKDRTGLFVDRIFKIDESIGEELMAWVKSGKPAPGKQDLSHVSQEIVDLIDLLWDEDTKIKAQEAFKKAGDNYQELVRIREKLVKANGKKGE